MKNETASFPERDLPLFCQELHQLYRAGIAPAEAVDLMRADEDDPERKDLLDRVYDALLTGAALGDALRESGAFPSYLTDMISLAEVTGRLEDTLLALQRHYERRLRLRSELRSAVTVPVLLLAVMLAVLTMLIVHILPIFDRVFAQLGVRMGGAARAMLGLGTALADAGTVLSAIVGVLAVAALIVALVPGLRRRFAAWFNTKFGGRGVLGQLAVSRFASSMAMAAASGMSMDEAVTLASKLCGGAREIDEKLALCRQSMGSGDSPADALAGSGLFSGRDCRLLKLSERTGTLPDALEDLAARQEEESLGRISRLVGLIEPGIVVITSVLAGVILLSVMMPMLGLLSGV